MREFLMRYADQDRFCPGVRRSRGFPIWSGRLQLGVDAREIHARGRIPIFASILEAPVKAFLKKTFAGSLPS
jgi:hypothetical protein